MKCEFAEQRNCRKIEVSIDARYFCGNFLAFGNAINCSESCMCIKTKICIPLNSFMQIMLTSKKGTLNISVKVMKYFKSNGLHDTMSVKILNMPGEYVELVRNICPSSDR